MNHVESLDTKGFSLKSNLDLKPYDVNAQYAQTSLLNESFGHFSHISFDHVKFEFGLFGYFTSLFNSLRSCRDDTI